MRNQLIKLKESVEATLNAETDWDMVNCLVELNECQAEMAKAIREWTYAWNEKRKGKPDGE